MYTKKNILKNNAKLHMVIKKKYSNIFLKNLADNLNPSYPF